MASKATAFTISPRRRKCVSGSPVVMILAKVISPLALGLGCQISLLIFSILILLYSIKIIQNKYSHFYCFLSFFFF